MMKNLRPRLDQVNVWLEWFEDRNSFIPTSFTIDRQLYVDLHREAGVMPEQNGQSSAYYCTKSGDVKSLIIRARAA